MSFAEIVIILLVALVVLGAEDLLRMVRTAGFLWGRCVSFLNKLHFDLLEEMNQRDVARFDERKRKSSKINE